MNRDMNELALDQQVISWWYEMGLSTRCALFLEKEQKGVQRAAGAMLVRGRRGREEWVRAVEIARRLTPAASEALVYGALTPSQARLVSELGWAAQASIANVSYTLEDSRITSRLIQLAKVHDLPDRAYELLGRGAVEITDLYELSGMAEGADEFEALVETLARTRLSE